METSAGEVCVWCDKEKAVSSIFDNGRPVYCEKCQRELLKEFGTPEALAEWERTRKVMKYHNKKVECDGIIFDSIKEKIYYDELEVLRKAGEVIEFERQVTFELQPKFKHAGKTERAIKYIADFVVKYKDGRTVVVDVKGFRTKEYLLKRKMLLYKHPDMIFEEV